MNIYLIRHGETLMNILKKNQGWIDSELTQNGIDSLKEMYQKNNLPEFDQIYCSDLGRAKATLEVIKPFIKYKNNKEIIYTFNLRERFLGSFEGDSLPENRLRISNNEGYENFDEYMTKKTFWDFVNVTKKYDSQGLAEDFSEFSSRVDEVINKIKQSNDENVLIISHANTVRYIAETLVNKSIDFEITNGKAIRITGNGDIWEHH